ALRSAAACSRRVRLSAVSSYSNCASGAPRRTSDSARTTTVRSSKPARITSSSPTLSSLLGLQRSPLQCTLPPSMAALANARVLKKRAAHNHLSRRTLPSSFSLIIQLCQRCHVIGSYSRSLKNHLCWQYFVKTASNCSFRKLNSAFRLFRLVLPRSEEHTSELQSRE